MPNPNQPLLENPLDHFSDSQLLKAAESPYTTVQSEAEIYGVHIAMVSFQYEYDSDSDLHDINPDVLDSISSVVDLAECREGANELAIFKHRTSRHLHLVRAVLPVSFEYVVPIITTVHRPNNDPDFKAAAPLAPPEPIPPKHHWGLVKPVIMGAPSPKYVLPLPLINPTDQA